MSGVVTPIRSICWAQYWGGHQYWGERAHKTPNVGDPQNRIDPHFKGVGKHTNIPILGLFPLRFPPGICFMHAILHLESAFRQQKTTHSLYHLENPNPH